MGKRSIRFTGSPRSRRARPGGAAWSAATMLAAGLGVVGCQGESPVLGSLHGTTGAIAVESGSLPLGAPCVGQDEAQTYFPGYSVSEVVVETSNTCSSGICVINHMQGRASCPYGQTAAQAANGPTCFVPYHDQPVKVAVQSQLTDRTADIVATCGCRCAGPGAGPFCTCPNGMECVELIDSNSLLATTDSAGSYCVLAGSKYDANRGSLACQESQNNCGGSRPH